MFFSLKYRPRNIAACLLPAGLALLAAAPSSSAGPRKAEIKIDGEVDDWKGISALANDVSEGAHPCDWRKLFMANGEGQLYLRYATDQDIDFTKGSAYMVFLDTDASQATGFQGPDGSFAVGAEFLLQGLTLFHYTGTGLDWVWENLGEISGRALGTEAEFAIDLLQLGSPETVDVILYGDNEAEGVDGQTLDVLPDDAFSPGGKISYSLAK